MSEAAAATAASSPRPRATPPASDCEQPAPRGRRGSRALRLRRVLLDRVGTVAVPKARHRRQGAPATRSTRHRQSVGRVRRRRERRRETLSLLDELCQGCDDTLDVPVRRARPRHAGPARASSPGTVACAWASPARLQPQQQFQHVHHLLRREVRVVSLSPPKMAVDDQVDLARSASAFITFSKLPKVHLARPSKVDRFR